MEESRLLGRKALLEIACVAKADTLRAVRSSSTGATDYERLSDREREVLKLLADGLAPKEIAARLLLSVKTVDAHKTNMMRKLDLHDRSEVIKFAIQRKLIRLPAVTTGNPAGAAKN